MNEERISKANVLKLLRSTAENHRGVAADYKNKDCDQEARVWSKMAECLGMIANRIERGEAG